MFKWNSRSTCVLAAVVASVLAWAEPSAAANLYVPAGGDLQAALNTAQPGDVVLLQAGATFRGKYTLPVKSNPAGLFITVRSAAADSALPPAGTRVTPSYAGQLPILKSSDTLPVLTVPPGASYWRIQCIEFQANVSGSSDIIRVGTNLETVPANQPHHVVFDRLYIHGDPAIGQKNGLVVHASNFELRESYVSDIKLVGTETHAFVSYNGAGPYLLENNYLEAAGINVIFGGADPTNSAMIPSNITVRRNHVAKNVAWMTPLASGQYWNVKNLFELKSGRNVTITGNVFENNWNGAGDQPGYAVLFRTENQGGGCDWCETGNVLFENNIVRHSPAGLSLMGLDYPELGTARGVRMHDVAVRNNLFVDLDPTRWVVGTSITTAKFALINGVDRLALEHNTAIMPLQTAVLYFTGSYDSPDFVYTNNMSEHRNYGIKGDSTGMGKATLDAFTVNYRVTGSVLAGASTTIANGYPAGNYFPSVSAWQGEFVDYAGGNYRLRSTSMYRLAGTDGKDLGADLDAIDAAIATTVGAAGSPHPPAADSQTVSGTEDQARAVVLTGTDPDGDTLTFTITAQPAHGVLTGTAPTLTYTPASNYNGADSFTFTVSDGNGGSATGTVSIAVAAVNDAPVANAQSVTTPRDTPIRFTVDASDVDGDALTYVLPSTASGTLTPIAGGVYEFTPTAGYAGTNTITYRVTDPAGATASATMTFVVTATNRAPSATAQTVSVAEDQSVAIALSATDPDGDALTYSVGTPASGRLSGTAPALTYTPNPNFHGTDRFSYTVTDPAGLTATTTVSITVTAVNDAPVAVAMSTSTAANTPVAIVLQGSDVDGDTLAWSVTAPRYGTLSGTAPMLTYVPGTNFAGTDTFTFTVSDGRLSSTATVTVQVTGNTVSVTTTSLGQAKVGKRYAQDLQAAGGTTPYAWSVISGSLPPGVSLAGGRLSGTPTAAGTYTFTVQVTDNAGISATKPLSIRVVGSRQ
jgi:hypothetical protein